MDLEDALEAGGGWSLVKRRRELNTINEENERERIRERESGLTACHVAI